MATMTADLLHKIRDESEDLERAAEELRFRLARGEDVDPSFLLVFDRLGWDKRRVQTEIERAKFVDTLRERAGSDDELADLLERDAELQKTVPPVIHQLEDQLAKLQALLTEERAKLTSCRHRIEEIEQNRLLLRENAPTFIQRLHARTLAQAQASPFAQKFRDVRARVEMIKKVLQDLSVLSQDAIHGITLHAETACPEVFLPRSIHGGMREPKEIDPAKWARYIEGLRAELWATLPQFETMQEQYQDLLADVDGILDFYLNSEEQNEDDH
jgi:DNA repair exonuclease SbcCD ATPase subunit